MPRILVVEDGPTQAQEIQLILESEGFDVEVAADGPAGLERFRGAPFDLVLSEIMMPGFNGYELCRKIRVEAGRGETPVVFLTTLNDPADVIKGLEVGADDYILKTYGPEHLLARIKSVLSRTAAHSEGTSTPGEELASKEKVLPSDTSREKILSFLASAFEDIVRAKQKEYESKNAEEALRASYQFLQATLDSLPDHVAVLDAEGTILAVNGAWRRFAEANDFAGTD